MQQVELPQSDNEWQEIEYEELGLKIFASLNTPSEKIKENIVTNLKRDLPQVWPHKEQDTVVALVAGGPSLVDTLDELKEVQANGGKVVALANTVKTLLDHGIKPSAQVLLDAKPNNENFIHDVEGCTYFVASQCDPAVFDKLEGQRVLIWHAMNSTEEFEIIHEYTDQWVPIQGGSTIALRAIRLLQIMGYSNFEIFGLDSCFLDGKHHAYDQPNADNQESVQIKLNDHIFTVSAWMVQQSMDFMTMVKAFGQDWNLKVHGPGLIATMIREGGKGE